MAHQTISDTNAVLVTRKTDNNGNSVYTATCGGLRATHRYDPAISRDANVIAAAAKLAGNAPMRGASTAFGWIFVHLHK